MYAEVIVDLTNSEVDKIFEYSFSDCRITLGSRVVVPFGPKAIEGIVINIKDKSDYPASKIKPILRLLEEMPALTAEMLDVMNFVAETCFVTRAAALRLFLPVEMRKGKVKEQYKKFLELSEEIAVEQIVSSLKKNAIKQ